MSNELFEGIPETRNDEECPSCGGGSLNGIVGGHRRVSENLEQSVWKCNGCRELVYMLDEDKDQCCPTCGTEGALSMSDLESMKEPLKNEKLENLLLCERSIKRLESYYYKTKVCPECFESEGVHHVMCYFKSLLEIYS